jgi:prephenate dehydrogenase
VSGAGIVVLAAPVRAIIELIEPVADAMSPGSLLMDLGSTKRQVAEAMGRIPHAVSAVGGHPMCGREVGGLENAAVGLFRGAVFVLTPTERSTGASMERAAEVAVAAGAHPLMLDAHTHDSAVATISHLPYLLAASLVHTERAASLSNHYVSRLAAGGFRDTTRVAGSEVAMMRDILLTNRDEIEHALDLFEESLAAARKALKEPPQLEQWMEQARARRMEIIQ